MGVEGNVGARLIVRPTHQPETDGGCSMIESLWEKFDKVRDTFGKEWAPLTDEQIARLKELEDSDD